MDRVGVEPTTSVAFWCTMIYNITALEYNITQTTDVVVFYERSNSRR